MYYFILNEKIIWWLEFNVLELNIDIFKGINNIKWYIVVKWRDIIYTIKFWQ
jgi:hypothetical protein